VSASWRKTQPKRRPKQPSLLYNGDCDWFVMLLFGDVMVMDGGD